MGFCRASRWCCVMIAAWQVLLSTAITLHHRHEGGGTTHSHVGGATVVSSESPLGEPPHAHLILLGFEFFLGEEDESAPTSPTPALACELELGYRPGGISDDSRTLAGEPFGDIGLVLPSLFTADLLPRSDAPPPGASFDRAVSVALLYTSSILRI